MTLPFNLEERKAGKTSGYVKINFDIVLNADSSLIQIKATVDNQAKDHRIRLYIPQHIASKTTLADHQFGAIERNIVDDAINVWQQEHWSERPDAIYPMLSYVKMKNDRLSFITNSIREYEAIDDKALAVTLY